MKCYTVDGNTYIEEKKNIDINSLPLNFKLTIESLVYVFKDLDVQTKPNLEHLNRQTSSPKT
jgi:hypothetical protein